MEQKPTSGTEPNLTSFVKPHTLSANAAANCINNAVNQFNTHGPQTEVNLEHMNDVIEEIFHDGLAKNTKINLAGIIYKIVAIRSAENAASHRCQQRTEDIISQLHNDLRMAKHDGDFECSTLKNHLLYLERYISSLRKNLSSMARLRAEWEYRYVQLKTNISDAMIQFPVEQAKDIHEKSVQYKKDLCSKIDKDFLNEETTHGKSAPMTPEYDEILDWKCPEI